MSLPNIFEIAATDALVARINQLSAATQAQWGTMNVAQMLAHCNVTYEMVYETKHAKPNAFVGFMLRLFLKNKVVSTAPYPKNGGTAPQFVIKDSKDFEFEKQRLVAYLQRTQTLGASDFEQKESHSFGKLTATEWSNMFYKHLEHHLTQFGV